MKQGIIVIDIGMTNKKVAVYDEDLVQQAAVYKEFLPLFITDPVTGNRIPAHNLPAMEDWFCAQISLFAQEYPVQSIAVTTHGATFVCVDDTGAVCAPCVFYTYEPGEDFQEEFYRTCGSAETLQVETFTPRFSAMINLAKGIFFLQKNFSQEFSRTKTILTFPQYWSFRFTGKKVCEPTYLACHTYLWNQNSHEWSSVVDSLGIRSRMPDACVPTCSILGTLSPPAAEKLGLDPSVVVTAGIHDSNASLLPYLADENGGKDFILNSTGTWCVCMHPETGCSGRQAEYTADDIGRVVFYNRSALDQPVKTAIFPGGMEVDTYVRLYQKINKTDAFPVSDMETVQKILTEKRLFIFPEIVPGSGQFPSAQPGMYENGRFFPFAGIQEGSAVPLLINDEKLFFAALDISIVIQTEKALYRSGLQKGTTVCTEGGFRRNKLYNELLASVLRGSDMFLTNMKEATASGCAMSALMAVTGKKCEELGHLAGIEYHQVAGATVYGYEAYKADWLMLMENSFNK
jgi:L-fuculokinase